MHDRVTWGDFGRWLLAVAVSLAAAIALIEAFVKEYPA